MAENMIDQATHQIGQKPKKGVSFTLKRDKDDGNGISGVLYDQYGKLLGFTMEPGLARAEHPGIPVGEYSLSYTMSNRLQKMTLEVLKVPNRAGIRIHSFNYPYQSKGCIGIGTRRGLGMVIMDSRPAIKSFESIVTPLLKDGIPVYIVIENI